MASSEKRDEIATAGSPTPDERSVERDLEKAEEELPKADKDESIDTSDDTDPPDADIDHEEVERMDELHQEDVIRIKSNASIARSTSSKSSDEDIQRISTRASRASTKSRISRIASALSSRSKKGRIRAEKVPITNLDEGIVGWESQDDPELPQNFPRSRKFLLLSLLSSITFISPLASSMFAPAVSFVDSDFGVTSEVLTALVVSIYVLGFAIGPLFLSPLSEIYGRRPVLAGANIFFCVWQIGCALAPNMSALIVFRFLAGVGGSGCLTIGGGVIADLFRPEERGMASSIYSIGPLFGPIVGPICGGFIGELAGWRWVFWVLLILGTVITTMIEILNRETNPRILILRKTIALRKELDRPELRSCYDNPNGVVHSRSKILIDGLQRPMRMLFLSPIISIVSLYMSVIYGMLYLLFTTITSVFVDTYDWSNEICGLAYLGLGAGTFIGLITVARISDVTVVKMTKANGGVFEPEMRLPACIFFASFIPISFFWYGWTAYYKVHWIVPILGLVPFGFGTMGLWIPSQTFIIDAFPAYAASGIAAMTVSRSLFGAFLPISGPYMYNALGLGWGNSVLGFIGIGLIPAPLFIFKYGRVIREKYPIKL